MGQNGWISGGYPIWPEVKKIPRLCRVNE